MPVIPYSTNELVNSLQRRGMSDSFGGLGPSFGGMGVRAGIDDVMRMFKGPPPGSNPFAIRELLQNMAETLKVPVHKLGSMLGHATPRRAPNPQSWMRPERVTKNMVEDLPDMESAIGISPPKTMLQWLGQQDRAFRMSDDMVSELVRMGRN